MHNLYLLRLITCVGIGIGLTSTPIHCRRVVGPIYNNCIITTLRSNHDANRVALGPDCANDAVQAATWKCNGSALVLFLTLNISSSTSTASNNLTFVRRKAKIILQAPGAGSSLKTVMLPRPIPKSERPSKSAFIRQRNLRNRS